MIAVGAFFLFASTALADPCKFIPDRGRMPTSLYRGVVFSGPVVYVIDGDGLCVDVGRANGGNLSSFPGASWVEVRVADFYAPELHDAGGPEAKQALERLALGRRAVCVADHQSYDRVVATCRLDGVSVGDLMRRTGIAEGGRAYPPRR